nr:hypothetical protein [uncultured Noviherbaspirillum sp.]
MSFSTLLQQHVGIQNRRMLSLERLSAARKAFKTDKTLSNKPTVSVFAAGSLGRLDSGKKSDLDVFVTSNGESSVGRLEEIEIFASILHINENLEYEPPSNDGEFLKVFHVQLNELKVGSSADDKENWFTTRMLMLLESNYLSNYDAYEQHKKAIIDFYFRDAAKQKPFKPLFLLNDILRFWRTLCLNYEQVRNTPTRSWKKRNFNLKYSRLLTVFGTVLPLILMNEATAEKFSELTSHSPIERLARGLDCLVDAQSFVPRFNEILDNYEYFLAIKESQDFDKVGPEIRNELNLNAAAFSEFIFDALNHSSVPLEYRKYLVI